jgi:hypothetical protein
MRDKFLMALFVVGIVAALSALVELETMKGMMDLR